MDMIPSDTSNDIELQKFSSEYNSSNYSSIRSPQPSPLNINAVSNQNQESANRAKASSFSINHPVNKEWSKNDTRGRFDSLDDVNVRYSSRIDFNMALNTNDSKNQSMNLPSPGPEGSSKSLTSGIFQTPPPRNKNDQDKRPNLSPVSSQKSLLPPINLNMEDSDHSHNIPSRYFDSDSDTSAKNACISKMNKLHRHKPSSYCFKEIVAPNNQPFIQRDLLEFDTSPESSEQSPMISELSHTESRTFKKRFFTSSNILLGLLVLWAMCSVYFIVYGTSWSFNNYLKSLPDSKKKELIDELSLRYATSLGDTDLKHNYLEDKSVPIFKGVVYNPPYTNLPDCGLLRSAVVHDLKKLSTVTTRLKTHGTQCNQAAYILDAISEHNLNLTLSLGIWLNADLVSNNDQMLFAKSILKTYDPVMIDSVFVGSGTLYNEALDEMSLVQYITDIKSYVHSNGLGIPVGTTESPEYLTASLVDSCDVIGLKLQPFLSGISSSEATTWASKSLKETKRVFDNGYTKFLISEIGWPYQGGSFKEATASPKDAQIFLDSWVCKEAKEDYYYFEAFDEPWKEIFNTEENYWESEWGIFSFQRHEKSNLTLPTCD